MTAATASLPVVQFLDNNGHPAAGYQLYTYLAGTTTPATTWQDKAQATANTNPITLDARGECMLWLDATKTYKFALKTAAGAAVKTLDNVPGASSTSDLAAFAASLASTSGASLVGYSQGGTGAVARTVQAKISDFVTVLDFGTDTTGATDAAAALRNAIAATPAGGTLYYSGTPLIASTVTISTTITLSAAPGAYFKKSATLNGAALILATSGIRMVGGGVVGVPGNGGDNIQIIGRHVTLRDVTSNYAGGNGIRVGADDSAHNENLFCLDNCTTSYNGGHGIYIHDAPGGAPNANGGTIINPDTSHNGGDGIRFGNSAFNTLASGSFQNNTGYGVNYASGCSNITRVGGDAEANTAGDVYIDINASQVRQVGTRFGESVTDMTRVVGNNVRRSNKSQNDQTRLILDAPRNWPFVVTGTSTPTKTVSAISVSGTTATATISGHSYAAGDAMFFYPNISGQNPADAAFGGPWTVASVVDANTVTFALPAAGFPAVAAETYTAIVGYPTGSTATGTWRIDDGWVTFETFLVLDAGSRNAQISGNLSVYGIPLLNTLGNVHLAATVAYCANLSGYVPIGRILAADLSTRLIKQSCANVAAGSAYIPVADLAISAGTQVGLTGRYRAF